MFLNSSNSSDAIFQFFPTCQVRVVRFYVSCPAPSFLPSSLLPGVLLPSFRVLLVLLLAGSHLPALDRSGPRRTSTASSRSQWASPFLNRRESERCGNRRDSEHCGTVGLAGPQPDPNGQKQSHIECHRVCQIECQIECQKICQIDRMSEDIWIECQKI